MIRKIASTFFIELNFILSLMKQKKLSWENL